MPKSKVFCPHCDAKLAEADAFCPNCKHPTMFATVEQRTAWELEQWTSKRTSPRKKVVAAAVKPRRATAIIEQPASTHPLAASAPELEPIKRVQTPRTIHPTVAARAARQAAAGVQPMAPLSSSPPMRAEKDRVIVLPDVRAAKKPAATAVKKIARSPKKEPAPKKDAVAKEAAPKKGAEASTMRPKAAPRKAPKMAPMPIQGPAPKSNGHASNGNGHVSNGNGHASNGNGAAAHGTSEQTEILRELLRRVVAIEEKMTVRPPRARRFRLRKR